MAIFALSKTGRYLVTCAGGPERSLDSWFKSIGYHWIDFSLFTRIKLGLIFVIPMWYSISEWQKTFQHGGGLLEFILKWDVDKFILSHIGGKTNSWWVYKGFPSLIIQTKWWVSSGFTPHARLAVTVSASRVPASGACRRTSHFARRIVARS